MKEYKFYNAKSVISYALISSVIVVASFIFNYTIIALAFLVAAIIFINKAKCTTYNVYDNRIEVVGFNRKEYLWTEFSDVLIGNWFIRIKTKTNKTVHIIDTNSDDVEFIKLMDQIIIHTNSDVLKYEDKENPTNLGINGSIGLLLFHLISNGIVYISTPLTQVAMIILGSSLWLSIIIVIFAIALLVLTIVLTIKYIKQQVSAIKLIKISKVLGFGFLILTSVSSFIFNPSSLTFKMIFMSSASVIGNFFSIFLVFEYLKTSNRAKHYFVK